MPHLKIKDRIKSFRRVLASELKPNPHNWRTHPETQRSALEGSLNELGYYDAVVARVLEDGSLELVDGHLRADVTPDTKIPVLITDLTEEEAAKALLTHDPLAAMAGQDDVLLAGLADMVEFADAELAAVVDNLLPSPNVETKDIVPPLPPEPVTKPGDLILLGEHRVLCGDATKPEDVARLMDGHKADLVFTSPPYMQQRDYSDASDCSDWDGLMVGAFGNLPAADGCQVLVNLGFVFKDEEWVPYWDTWIEWMRAQSWKRYGFYVWDKGEAGRRDGRRLTTEHEFIFHFCQRTKEPIKCEPCVTAGHHQTLPEVFSSQKGQHRDKRGSCIVGETKRRSSVCHVRRTAIESLNHPAMFPAKMSAFYIESWPGDVYDPFLGSGTTLAVTEQLGRRCFGMEIEPAYCDVVVQRWENLTGKKAERIPAEVLA